MIRRASEQQREEKTSQLQKLREELAELGETIKSKIMDEFDDLTHWLNKAMLHRMLTKLLF